MSKSLEDIILKGCSTSFKILGKSLFNKNLVKRIQGKKIDEIYHIYGSVEEKNNCIINTHIKIDLKNKKLDSYTCNCNKAQEFLKEGHRMYCHHIAATSYKFLSLNKSQSVKPSVKPKSDISNVKKEILYINAKLVVSTEKFIDMQKKYILELSLQKNNINYPIRDLNLFLNCLNNNTEYAFTDKFIFTNKKYTIKEKDLILLKYLFNLKDNHKIRVVNSKILFPSIFLKDILDLIPEGNFNIQYDYLQYKCKINHSTIPFAITLKVESNDILITAEKNLPISLNTDDSVYIFNREIYCINDNIPLKSFLDNVRKNIKLKIKATQQNYNNIINTIHKISSNVIISESFMELSQLYQKAYIHLERNNNDIIARINILIGNDFVKITTKNLMLFRNSKWENRIIMELERCGFAFLKNQFIFKGTDEQLYNLLKNNSNFAKLNCIIDGKCKKNCIKIYNGDDLSVSLRQEDWAIKFTCGLANLSSEIFREAYLEFLQGKEFYRIKNGNYVNLKDARICNTFKFIHSLSLTKVFNDGISYIDNSKSTFVAEIIKDNKFNFINVFNEINSLEGALNQVDSKFLNSLITINGTLRKYQIDGVKWLYTLDKLGCGGLLADEMGLGKTIQIISFLSMYKNKNSLIVAPSSLTYNWKAEFNKFAPQLKIEVVDGEVSKREKILSNYKEYDVLITSYGLVKNDINIYTEVLFDYIVIDEAQNIKNPNSENAKSIKKLNGRNKFALTGTPIENNIVELWSIFDFILPGYLYSQHEFNERFFVKDGNELLKSYILPFILKRHKKEVLKELPNKTEKIIYLSFSNEEKEIYDNYINKTKDILLNNIGEIEILSYLLKLRQICIHPKLVDETYTGESTKFIHSLKVIKNKIIENNKILIFSQFKSALDLFSEMLQLNNISYYYINGNTPTNKRLTLTKKFNDTSDVKVFLISLKAGGVGLNLTGANTVIHLDQWWNPAVENQATDRAHRLGQKETVKVLKLTIRDSIEENVLKLQESKRQLIEDILSDDNYSKLTLDKDTIKNILNIY